MAQFPFDIYYFIWNIIIKCLLNLQLDVFFFTEQKNLCYLKDLWVYFSFDQMFIVRMLILFNFSSCKTLVSLS